MADNSSMRPCNSLPFRSLKQSRKVACVRNTGSMAWYFWELTKVLIPACLPLMKRCAKGFVGECIIRGMSAKSSTTITMPYRRVAPYFFDKSVTSVCRRMISRTWPSSQVLKNVFSLLWSTFSTRSE